MTLTIPNEILERSGLTEREVVIEVACRMFDAGKLTQFFAAKLAGLTRVEFEEECFERKIPLYRIDEKYLDQEFESAKNLKVRSS